MKRRREEEDAVPRPRHEPLFDFPNLLPELRAEVRSHMSPLTRHLLRLTSRDMLADDRAPPAIPDFLVSIEQWLRYQPHMRVKLEEWHFVFWERELGAATILGGEVPTDCLVSWDVSETLILRLCCDEGLHWRIEERVRSPETGYSVLASARAVVHPRQMEALRRTINDWLDAGRVLHSYPRLDATNKDMFDHSCSST